MVKGPHALWYPALSSHPPPPPPSSSNDNSNNALSPSHQHHRNTYPPQNPQRTLLSILRTDENIVLHRKANIRRFGAGWLRPPGVGKTLQGMADERAEREEVEGARAREYALAEAQAAAEADALANAEGLEGEEDGGDMGERDLDDEVPDLDADAGAWSDADMTEDEREGELDPTEEHGEGVLEEEGGGDFGAEIGERDLDDEIPDADAGGGGMEVGEYEHTDTEVEDSSSEDDGVVVQRQGPVMGTFRQSENGFAQRGIPSSSGVLGSSVFGSSPVRDSLGGVRRDGGRRSRGRRREN
ncbi:hypothetical protein OEA41_009440 [Lepraria neglecta]|uniref:Uncharacterized protein n=1 Tax=Lepraria neglecta TaxID=209136 RepID=A0AAD9Z2B9_9LECA|nr:hypothetical protein OEA41_009440 [Lepraria neglecta]